MSDYRIENKQVDINDIYRLAETLEEYKEEWIQRAKTEDEYVSSIDTSRTYGDLESKTEYEIDYKDGRTVTGKETSWLMENILDIDIVKNVNIFFTLYYYSSKNDKDFNRQQSHMYIRLYITREPNEYKDNIKIDIDSNLDDDSKIVHTQLTNMKNDYEKTKVLSASEIVKFAKFIDGYAQEWKMKEINENQSMEHAPTNVKKVYDNLDAIIRYRIEYYDGKEKTEDDYEWFKTETSKIKNIKDINIRYYMSFFDKKNSDGDIKSISADIDFHTTQDSFNSYARYSVDSNRLETEADILYGKIDSVFRNNPTRYESIIKNRTIITQAFSVAVGIVLSYIIYIALKVGLGNSDGFFDTLLKNKNVIVFGQWIVAAIAGNVFASWFINMTYKSMLPDRRYVRYNRNSGKSEYRDEVDDYIKDSEVQIGKFYDLRQKRALIKKMFKISLIVITVQLVISVLLFLILK